jgi:uncharacterized protein YgbK (DUF1537 family)
VSVPAPLIVLDDDPTGAQAQAGVPVALEWSTELLGELAVRRPAAIHILTNARALAASEAESVTREAASHAAEAFPGAPVVLRGDSTLRAHLLPEYLGLRDALYDARTPVLMLVPALPAAGRITRGGVHHLRSAEELIPLDRTEYARDGEFAYASARLLDWAEERSQGFFAAAAGRELLLEQLRGGGPGELAGALADLGARGVPAVLAVDSVTDEDLALVADGLREAMQDGTEVIVRSAPAFVGVLSGAAADGYQPLPAGASALLVLCGSHVPTSTRQLARLVDARPESVVWVSAERLAGADGKDEVSAAAVAAGARLDEGGLAVVATSRAVLDSADRVQAGAAIASGLAAILARVRERADIVVSKGGITSAVNIREGLESGLAEVLGPVMDGVSLWSVDTPEREALPFVVFPGNVGGDSDLLDLVQAIGAAR